MQLSRREFVERTGILAASLGLSSFDLQDRTQSYGRDYPDMLLTYLAHRLNALAARWDTERAAIQ